VTGTGKIKLEIGVREGKKIKSGGRGKQKKGTRSDCEGGIEPPLDRKV